VVLVAAWTGGRWGAVKNVVMAKAVNALRTAATNTECASEGEAGNKYKVEGVDRAAMKEVCETAVLAVVPPEKYPTDELAPAWIRDLCELFVHAYMSSADAQSASVDSCSK